MARWQQKAAAIRDTSRKLVWFHAPSVGEGLQARPVIDALRLAHPEVQVAYSFFSPSAEQFAQALNVDMADYLPFDSAGAANALMGALTPTALFFSKLDVWPSLVAVAKQRNVVTGLLSATVAPGSGRQGFVANALLRDAYRALDIVGAIDRPNAQRLARMGVVESQLTVSGDTRFDQVWTRAAQVNRGSALLVQLASTRPTVVAGSTWPADEAVLLPAWQRVREQVRDARLVIAPHEPSPAHVASLQGWASEHRLTAMTLGALPAHTGASPDMIIVDRTGVLGDIYAIANVAFVGGGFHSAGLHSVLEPAAYGVPVVFGPGFGMSREAGLLLQHEGARSVSSIEQCAMAVAEWLESSTLRERAGRAAMAFVKSELGAAQRSLALVMQALA